MFAKPAQKLFAMIQISHQSLSYAERLDRELRLVHLNAFHDVYRILWKARRINLGIEIYEEHAGEKKPKWRLVDIWKFKGVHRYWMVTLTDAGLQSFTMIQGELKKCMKASFVELSESIADPNDIRRYIKKPEDINYVHNLRRPRPKWPTPTKTWTWLSDRTGIDTSKLPLGKPYRAIDIGSLVPVFRFKDRVIGISIK